MEELTEKEFRKKVYSLISDPVGRVCFRKDTFGLICTVYFDGVVRSLTIAQDSDCDGFEWFENAVKCSSAHFVSEAKKCFGDNWRKYVKHRD